MSEAAPPATAAPQPAPSASPAPTTPPPKKPGLIRWVGIILIAVLVLGTWASFPWLVEPWILRQIQTSVESQGFEVGPETTWKIDVLGGSINATPLRIIENYNGVTETVLAADDLAVDFSIMDLMSADIILDAVHAQGVTGTLKRRGPKPKSDPSEPDQPVDDTEATDWLEKAKQAYNWYKNREEDRKQAEEDKKNGTEPEEKLPPKKKKDRNWAGSYRYEPTLPPGRGPRVLIHDLKISGKTLSFAEKSPFDFTSFSITGTDVCIVQLADETMTLSLNAETAGSGPIDLNVERKPGSDGQFTLIAQGVPVAAIADPSVSGDTLAPYQPQGQADLNMKGMWTETALKAECVQTLTNFSFTPPPDNATAVAFANIVTRLKGKPLTWPIRIGGTLGSPKITDTGIDDLVKGGLKDAVTDAAKEEAAKRAQTEADKQLENNPELKKQKDQATGTIKNIFGK